MVDRTGWTLLRTAGKLTALCAALAMVFINKKAWSTILTLIACDRVNELNLLLSRSDVTSQTFAIGTLVAASKQHELALLCL